VGWVVKIKIPTSNYNCFKTGLTLKRRVSAGRPGLSEGPLVDLLFHMTHMTHVNHKRSESLYLSESLVLLSESPQAGKSEGPLVDFLFHMTHVTHVNHKRSIIHVLSVLYLLVISSQSDWVYMIVINKYTCYFNCSYYSTGHITTQTYKISGYYSHKI
jgi:hypothetical protein